MGTRFILCAITGLILTPVCGRLRDCLMRQRGKEWKAEKKEKVILASLMTLFGALIGLLVPLSFETLYLFLLLCIGEMIAVADIHVRLIPNELLLCIIILTVLFGIPGYLNVPGFPAFRPLYSFIGMAVCFGIFLLPAAFSKKVGAGDVKLAAVMGFCLGLQYSLTGIVLMGLFVLIYTLMQKRLPALKFLETMIPMGPFLALSMVTVLLLVRLPAVAGALPL